MRRYQIAVWVQERPGRFLSLEWHDTTGKRRSRSTRTNDAAEAEQQRAELERELNSGLAEPSRMPWTKFVERYHAEHLAGLRGRTREKFTTVNNVLLKVLPPSLLCDVNESFLSRFLAAIRNDREPWTQRNYLGALKTALNWAKRQKLIPVVPDFPVVKVPKLRPKAVPQEGYDKLFAALQTSHERGVVALGWWAGLRLSEAYELRREPSREWPWVNMDGKRIVLPAGFVKSHEDQWLPIHPKLAEVLADVEPIADEPERYFLSEQ